MTIDEKQLYTYVQRYRQKMRYERLCRVMSVGAFVTGLVMGAAIHQAISAHGQKSQPSAQSIVYPVDFDWSAL